MSAIFGLPVKGSDVKILITRVHLHPLSALVEFWGKFYNESAEDYQTMNKAIQSPGKYLYAGEGNAGDQCLVQIDRTWYRSRIVSKSGSQYSVFLIDNGVTYSTHNHVLAWGKKEFFKMPPEVECCVLANVLPLSHDNKWSPIAVEFVKSLQGQHVDAHVQEVLLSHRTWLLHIPCISKQMYEMGFAKKLAPNMFQQFVLIALRSPSDGESCSRKITSLANERLHKQELYMHPEIVAGTVETVVVTEVRSPHRIFCQLKVFSQELKNISDQMAQCYGGRSANCMVNSEMIGFPCAAKTNDGIWYRSVLQQVFPADKMVEVLNVDYGTKCSVQMENIRPLSPQFFRMPVVTYICSLHGIVDKDVGWTASQLEYLNSLILRKTVIAKFEYQSISEGVYYVTLYGDENINDLFSTRGSISMECEKTPGDYALHTRRPKHALPFGNVDEVSSKISTCPFEELFINSSHLALVQHVFSPSEFWIKTVNCKNELDRLMDSINSLYSDSEKEGVVKSPSAGLYCAARGDNGDFSRATILNVHESTVEVFFVDYGNTSEVPKSDIKLLPREFKKLPWLALKCSLAGVRPKQQKWSHDAIEFFIKQVIGNVLNVHVKAKHGNTYLVKLMDPEANRNEDLSELLCNSGLAEKVDAENKLKSAMSMQPAPAPQGSSLRFGGAPSNCWISPQTHANVKREINKHKSAAFKSEPLSIGSTLEVNVTCFKSPNDFWCQLGNVADLKFLMHTMQDCYAASEFSPVTEMACAARHPDNGMWYRALIVKKHEASSVDVLFVDYGQTETVSIHDLRAIHPEFLELQRQAFQCSLLNPVDPASVVDNWSEQAKEKCHSFVESAHSNANLLKCTIYAVKQNGAFNIVDLETPFESLSAIMGGLVKDAIPKLSLQHETYFYSTHNIKTGTEERVTVMCVKNVSQFYCQFERNADIMEDLKLKVNTLCRQLETTRQPAALGTVCFAKYCDGHWYRGQILASNPSVVVHFVDYGDTIKMDKSDLLPVPTEASNIMMVPVQAVLCSLSDIPAEVPTEVNTWFETSATDCKFTAQVVARESDGKLLVELYHKTVQINSKIKRMFKIGLQTGDILQSAREQRVSANWVHKTQISDANQWQMKSNIPKTFPSHLANGTNETQYESKLQTAPTQLKNERKNPVRNSKVELYKPPHKRQCNGKPRSLHNGSLPGDSYDPSKEHRPKEKKLHESSSHVDQSEKKPSLAHNSETERLPKIGDLPTKSITPDTDVDVFVSHCNSPLSFYLQLVKEEDQIFSLVDQLNGPNSSPICNIAYVQPGDLVQAEFEQDSSWYRAAVRELDSNNKVLLEFVDFGNTATITTSKLARLPRALLDLPVYSTHCMLSEAAQLKKDDVLDAQVVSSFKESINGIGEKGVRCKFVKQSGSVWEVSLKDISVNVQCKEPACSPGEDVFVSSDACEKLTTDVSQRRCQQPDVQQGSCLEVYITNTNEDQTFWCHSSDTEDLDRITSRVSKVGASADNAPFDLYSLSNGSPCIALFPEDNLWYRAEVIDKNGDELSVFYVDYGNKATVKGADVKKIPQDLLETPAQAFMCILDGIGSMHGSWQSGVVDELISLTADKDLQLTIKKMVREKGQTLCYVIMECEGVVMNDSLKTWWKTCTPQMESLGQAVSSEAQVSDSAVDPVVDEPLAETAKPQTVDPEHKNEDVHFSTPSEDGGQGKIECEEETVPEEHLTDDTAPHLNTPGEHEIMSTPESLMEEITVPREEFKEPSGSGIPDAQMPCDSLQMREGAEEDLAGHDDLKAGDELAPVESTTAEHVSASNEMVLDDSKSPCEETSTSLSVVPDFMIPTELHARKNFRSVKLIPKEGTISHRNVCLLDVHDEEHLESNLVPSEYLGLSSVFPAEPFADNNLIECAAAPPELEVETAELLQDEIQKFSAFEEVDSTIEDVVQHKEAQSAALQVEADDLPPDDILLISSSDKNDSVSEDEPDQKNEQSELMITAEDLSPDEVQQDLSFEEDASMTEHFIFVHHQNEYSELEIETNDLSPEQAPQDSANDENDSMIEGKMLQDEEEHPVPTELQRVEDVLQSPEIPQDSGLDMDESVAEEELLVCHKADDSGIPTDDVSQDIVSDEEDSAIEDLISFHQEDEHLADDPSQNQTEAEEHPSCTSTENENVTGAEEESSKLEDEPSASSCDPEMSSNKMNELVCLFDDISLTDTSGDQGIEDESPELTPEDKMGKPQEDFNDSLLDEASFADEGFDRELQKVLAVSPMAEGLADVQDRGPQRVE